MKTHRDLKQVPVICIKSYREFHENPQGFETNRQLKARRKYETFHENPQGFETICD